jgi:hypothetical protein
MTINAMLKIFRFIVIVWLGLLAGALMLVGIAFALISMAWSLLRGRKPAVVVVFQNLRHTAKGFRNGTWTAQKKSAQTPPTDIVDVEAHEIRPILPSQGGTLRK